MRGQKPVSFSFLRHPVWGGSSAGSATYLTVSTKLVELVTAVTPLLVCAATVTV
jgi:hypothetical protein